MVDEKSIVRSIACCIIRALRKSEGSPSDVNNEAYWYTREKASELCRRLNISFVKVISDLNEIEWLSDKELNGLTEPYWDELQSPLLWIAEMQDD